MAYKRSALMEERLAGARERILLATRELVATGGWRNAPVTAVATQAGVSTGLIYRHFPSKAELFVEVLNAAVAHEVAIMERIASGPEVASERLRLAITAFVRRALAGPGLAHAFIVEPVDPDVEAERMRGRRAFGDVFLRLVEEGVAAGELPAQDAHVAAAAWSAPSPSDGRPDRAQPRSAPRRRRAGGCDLQLLPARDRRPVIR
jgi:AcrR family transcriptional regulator